MRSMAAFDLCLTPLSVHEVIPHSPPNEEKSSVYTLAFFYAQ